MKASVTFLVAVSLLLVLGKDSQAQFGRPIPRPVMPRLVPHPVPHPLPVRPHPTPVDQRPARVAPAEDKREQLADRSDSSASPEVAASTVGLMISPQAQGPFFAATVLFSASTASSHEDFAVAARPAPVIAPAFAPRVAPQADPNSGVIAFMVISGLLVGASFLVYSIWKRSPSRLRIRIIATPPGEAPEEIRRAWVGMELPLAREESRPRKLNTVGVLSHYETATTLGYIVDGRTAVDLLASHEPHAAEWWRENAPHVVAFGYQLIFPAEVCERMDAEIG